MAVVVPMAAHGGAYADQVVVPASSVARLPEDIDFPAGSTVLMNALAARIVLDELALEPGQTLGVTGGAGAFGGYVIQLGSADGLRVVADSSEQDEELIRVLGADGVVARGDDVAVRFRELVPDGVDGFADGAVLDGAVLPAIRHGGSLATVRGWSGPSERDVSVHPVRVFDHVDRSDLIARLGQQVAEGVLTLRVARLLPAQNAAGAHRQLEAGGVRGRLILDFS